MSGEGDISLKRVKKTKCSDVKNLTLLEEIEKEKDLLTSHFQNGVTLKRKEMLWKHIADSVNAIGIGGNGRSVGQVKKRWKDMKSAVIDRQRQSTETGGGCPLPEIQYEDIIRRIIGEITNLVNGVEGKSQVPTSCKIDAFFLALQIILLKRIA